MGCGSSVSQSGAGSTVAVAEENTPNKVIVAVESDAPMVKEKSQTKEIIVNNTPPVNPSPVVGTVERRKSITTGADGKKKTPTIQNRRASQRNRISTIASDSGEDHIKKRAATVSRKLTTEVKNLIFPQDKRITYLPRGGLVIATSVGPIQIGIFPETIKDSMKLGIEVPTYFIAPINTFTTSLGIYTGINVAEFEFPAYFNFFIKKKKVIVICDTPEMEARFRAVFQETLLGPQILNTETIDYEATYPKEKRANLRSEMDYFAKFGDKKLNVDMLIEFYHYKNNSLTLTKTREDGSVVSVTITKDEFNYTITDNDLPRLSVPTEVKLPDLIEKPVVHVAFKPPLFGVTVLGSSHGFDPSGSTSGYVLWVNGKGIMIDPPPNSTTVLKDNHIYPSMINAVLVTHCHADHDAGTFQKLLQEGRVTLITTPTIFESFCRKYSALSGLDITFLKQIFKFKKVLIGQPLHIRGAIFNFFYSLHSIPCIGFEVEFGLEGSKKSIVFSADHMNDPKAILKLKEDNVISETRCNELLNFPWHHDLILHESGVPPIHTPMATLAELPDDVKQRLYVVHTTNSQVPKDKGLRAAPTGVQNTLILPVDVVLSEVMQVLDLMSSINIFRSLNMEHAAEILQIYRKRTFKSGDCVYSNGSEGDEFYVIQSGMASFSVTDKVSGEVVSKNYYPGDYFGEQILVTDDCTRTADITAITELELVYFHKGDFIRLIGDTQILNLFSHIRDTRNVSTLSDINRNSRLRLLSSNQITQLQEVLEVDNVEEGDVIWEEGSDALCAIIVGLGTQVKLFKNDGTSGRNFSRGAFICDVDAMRTFSTNEFALEVISGGEICKIYQADLLYFFTENPGFLVSVLGSVFIE